MLRGGTTRFDAGLSNGEPANFQPRPIFENGLVPKAAFLPHLAYGRTLQHRLNDVEATHRQHKVDFNRALRDKETELESLRESGRVLELRGRAAVDRCNDMQRQIESGREVRRQLERDLSRAETVNRQREEHVHELEETIRVLQAQVAQGGRAAAQDMLHNFMAAATNTSGETAAPDGSAGRNLGADFARALVRDILPQVHLAKHAFDGGSGMLRVGGDLGAGGHGAVVEATNSFTNEEYAVKTANGAMAQDILAQEAANLIKIGRHRNIVEVKAVKDDGGEVAILLERAEMDLGAALCRGVYSPIQMLKFASQVVAGVDFMHSKSLVHNDLKLNNVLLCSTGDGCTVAKVADFGLTCEMNETKLAGCATLGSSLTPDNFHAAVPADAAADVWALGILLLSVLLPSNMFRHNLLADPLLLNDADRVKLASCDTPEEAFAAQLEISYRTATDTSASGFAQTMIREEFLAPIEPLARGAACGFLRKMVDPDPSQRPEMNSVKNWVAFFIQSAERHAIVLATSAAAGTANTPRPMSPIHDTPASAAAAGRDGDGASEISTGVSTISFTTSENSTGVSTIVFTSGESDSSGTSSAWTDDSSCGVSREGVETEGEEDDDSSGGRRLWFYPGAFGDGDSDSSDGDAESALSSAASGGVCASPTASLAFPSGLSAKSCSLSNTIAARMLSSAATHPAEEFSQDGTTDGDSSSASVPDSQHAGAPPLQGTDSPSLLEAGAGAQENDEGVAVAFETYDEGGCKGQDSLGDEAAGFWALNWNEIGREIPASCSASRDGAGTVQSEQELAEAAAESFRAQAWYNESPSAITAVESAVEVGARVAAGEVTDFNFICGGWDWHVAGGWGWGLANGGGKSGPVAGRRRRLDTFSKISLEARRQGS